MATNQPNFSLNTLRPTAGHILVRPADIEKQTASGIYLPDSHDEAPLYGTVVAVGDDHITDSGQTVSSPVKSGDLVVYKKWGGNEFKMDNIDYQFLKFDDILAVSTSQKGRGRPKKNK